MTELRQLLMLARPHFGALLLGLLLSLLTTLSNIALLAVSGWFIAAMAFAGLGGAQMNYFTPAGIIRFLAMVRIAGRYAERLLTHNATFLLLSRLRVTLFERFSQSPQNMRHSADLLSRLQDDVELLDKFYLAVLLPVCIALIAVPMLLLVIARFDPNVALICAVGLILVGLGIPLLLSASLQQLGPAEREAGTRLRQEMLDTLTGMRELAVYGQSDAQLNRMARLRAKYIAEQDKTHRAQSRANILGLLFTQLTVLGTLAILVPVALGNTLPGPEIVMLLLLVLASFEAVLQLPGAVVQLPLILAAARRVFSDQALIPQPARKEIMPESATPDSLLEFAGVSARYQGSQENSLFDIRLTLHKGERLALVGRSGAGKSTLLRLISGELLPLNGRLSIGGKDGLKIEDEERFALLGILSQHPHLFADTVRNNMLLARPDANEEAIWRALKRAHIAAHVRSLPDGLDTRVGRFGEPLSAGQRRRLCLAQVLLRQSSLLVLDEPTEGLDGATERELMARVIEGLDDRALLLITHNPDLLASVDKVLWLEQGRIRACGTHEALLTQEPQYRELVTRL